MEVLEFYASRKCLGPDWEKFDMDYLEIKNENVNLKIDIGKKARDFLEKYGKELKEKL